MDFENFEFKPLTEGLGFHKKNSTASQVSPKGDELPPLEPREKFDFEPSLSLKNRNILKVDAPKFEDPRSEAPKFVLESTKFELPEVAPEVNSSSDLFSRPLPRTEQDVRRENPSPIISTIPKFNPRFSKPLSNIQPNTEPNIQSSIGQQKITEPAIQDKRIQSAGLMEALSSIDSKIKKETPRPNRVDSTVETKYIEVAPSALSLFLDLTVISGLSVLFTLGLVVATRIDVVPILTNSMSDLGTQIGIALLVFSVSQLYFILSRSFFGQTLGEWSMDTQVGLPKEQERVSYVFKLISRILVLTLTGFFILPLISMIVGKDLAGRAASLKLYRK